MTGTTSLDQVMSGKPDQLDFIIVNLMLLIKLLQPLTHPMIALDVIPTSAVDLISHSIFGLGL